MGQFCIYAGNEAQIGLFTGYILAAIQFLQEGPDVFSD